MIGRLRNLKVGFLIMVKKQGNVFNTNTLSEIIPENRCETRYFSYKCVLEKRRWVFKAHVIAT